MVEHWSYQTKIFGITISSEKTTAISKKEINKRPVKAKATVRDEPVEKAMVKGGAANKPKKAMVEKETMMRAEEAVAETNKKNKKDMPRWVEPRLDTKT